jgi:HK97 family phage major capsid protein
MKNVQQLRDERAEKIEALRSIDVVAEGEKRSLNADEKVKYDGILADIRNLDGDITRAEQREKLAIESVAAGSAALASKEDKELREYSITRAIRMHISGKMEGLEAEMHQEAVNEARANGVEIKNLGIPSMVMNAQKRDNSVTAGTQPADGAALVAKDVRPMIELLRAALITRELGATYMTGLRGNVSFPTNTTGASATWKSEIAELDKSNLKFGNVELSPKRLGTYAVVSKQLIAQSSADVEAIIRQDLMNAVAEALDIAAINGSGTSGQPLGILNTAGIGSIAMGTNGAAPTYEALVALEAEIEANHALRGKLAYLTTAKAKAKLKTTKLDAGSGMFILPGNEVNGYPVYSSALVPSDLSKGTGSNLSALIFGNWSDLMIGQWGGLDVMADPYTLATSGQIRLIVDSFWDIAVRRAKSFAAIKDAVTTLS